MSLKNQSVNHITSHLILVPYFKLAGNKTRSHMLHLRSKCRLMTELRLLLESEAVGPIINLGNKMDLSWQKN